MPGEITFDGETSGEDAASACASSHLEQLIHWDLVELRFVSLVEVVFDWVSLFYCVFIGVTLHLVNNYCRDNTSDATTINGQNVPWLGVHHSQSNHQDS